jgi:selenophosphate synthetase-related protein
MTETWIEAARGAFKDAVAIGHMGLAWDIIEDVKTAGYKDEAEVMAEEMRNKAKTYEVPLVGGRGGYQLNKSL